MADERPIWIIIPAYNASGHISRAVASALAHADPARVLVIDDGSTDGTADLARAAGAQVIVQTNGGPSVARNRGFDLAQNAGADALTLDADDEFVDGAGLAYGHALRDTPGVPLILGNFDRVNRRAKHSCRDMLRPHIQRHDGDPVAALLPRVPVTGSGVLVRHATLAAGLRQSTRMHVAEDRDFIYRACRDSRLAVTTPAVFRKHDVPGQMTAAPRLVRQFLLDIMHLVETHAPSVDPSRRPMLAPMVQHYLKQACKHSTKAARRMDEEVWDRAARLLTSLGSTPHWRTRKWYWASRMAGMIRGPAQHMEVDGPDISVISVSQPSTRPRA